jgi:hypothetical protein
VVQVFPHRSTAQQPPEAEAAADQELPHLAQEGQAVAAQAAQPQ